MNAKRPAPRTSTLAGRNPITPLTAARPDEATATSAEPAPRPEGAEPRTPTTKKPRSTTPRPAKTGASDDARPSTPTRMGVHMTQAQAQRFRGAYAATIAEHGGRSLSDFAIIAIERYVSDLEKKYNNGEPFPPRDAGDIRQGRPPILS